MKKKYFTPEMEEMGVETPELLVGSIIEPEVCPEMVPPACPYEDCPSDECPTEE